MSEVAIKMREACLTPLFTVDEQVMRVANCESNGFTLTTGGVEPQIAEIPVTSMPARDTVDAENTEPGSGGAGGFAEGTQPVSEQPTGVKAVTEWVKKNPLPAAGIAAVGLYFLLSKNRR